MPAGDSPTFMREGFDIEVLPMPYHMQPIPTPFRSGPPLVLKTATSSCAVRQCGLSASRHCASPAEWVSTWPVAVVSPTRSALRWRNSRRSIASRSASSSIIASWAMAAWGTPKPRKAPAGGPLVKKASPQLRTLGTA